MMIDIYDVMRMRKIEAPMRQPNLRTGEGHGHFRKSSRARPEKNSQVKKRKKAKMSKASRKRNRR